MENQLGFGLMHGYHTMIIHEFCLQQLMILRKQRWYPQEVDLIQSIPLCNSSVEDKLIWPYASSGQCTVQSGYKFLAKENLNNLTTVGLNQDNGVWKLVWGLSVPNKLKNFLWRACRNVMSAEVNLRKRMILTFDICDHCNRETKNILHALWDCSELAQISEALPEFNFHCCHCFSNTSYLILYAQWEGKKSGEVSNAVMENLVPQESNQSKNL